MPPLDPASQFSEHPDCARVREGIRNEANNLTETLVEWAEMNSGSHHPEGIVALAHTIEAYASFLPVKPQWLRDPESGQPCALSWRVQREASLPSVLLNGHIDTVYGPEHPFQKCTQIPAEGRIQGPGVTDMKGGLVILFAAIKAWLESGLGEQLSWEILLTFDEEIGSFQNTIHLQEAAQRHDLGITFESSVADGYLVRNRMGTGVVEVSAQGRSAHAGRDFAKGLNAVAALGRFVDRAHELNHTIPDIIVNVAHITGGGPTNVVPDAAAAKMNVRAKTAQGEQTVMTALRETAATVAEETGCELELSGGFTRPAKEATPATSLLMQAWEHCGAAMNVAVNWRDTGGASDGNILQAAGLPTIDNLGAIGDHIHSPREYIRVSSLVERAQLVASFLMNLSGGQFDQSATSWLVRLRTERKSR
jgi:glutamate carboxypeptidase